MVGFGDTTLLRVETLAGAAVLVDVLQGLEGQAAAPVGVRVEAFRGAGHGTVALLPAVQAGQGGLPGGPGGRQGVFRYVPQSGFVGVDAFGYRLTGDDAAVLRWVEIRVWAVNGPPVAVGDVVLVEGDGPVTFNVLANDRDSDGDGLRITGLKSLSQRFTRAFMSGAFMGGAARLTLRVG